MSDYYDRPVYDDVAAEAAEQWRHERPDAEPDDLPTDRDWITDPEAWRRANGYPEPTSPTKGTQ